MAAKSERELPPKSGVFAAKEKELAEIQDEAKRVGEDIAFFLQCAGSKSAPRLDFSPESLIDLERSYRSLAAPDVALPVDLPLDMLGRLVGIYLGEVIIRHQGGSWAIYGGKYHTFNRITVRTDKGYCDPLQFARFLPQAKTVRGALEGKALFRFVGSVDRLCFA